MNLGLEWDLFTQDWEAGDYVAELGSLVVCIEGGGGVELYPRQFREPGRLPFGWRLRLGTLSLVVTVWEEHGSEHGKRAVPLPKFKALGYTRGSDEYTDPV